MKKNSQFEYKNRYLEFLMYGCVIALTTGAFNYGIYTLNLFEEYQWVLMVLTLNVCSVVSTSLFVLAFVHYKSKAHFVKIDHNSISIPTQTLLPDTITILFDDIIFENRYTNGSEEVYAVVFNGGSVKLKKSNLKYASDWKKLVYELKEVIH